jgi:alpha-amylase
MRSLRLTRVLATALALALLSACGGGGGSASAQPLPTVDVSAVAAADPGTRLSADWKHGVFVEIFVRAYKDSDGDGIGDLRGLTSSLDYLKALGITGIWLMPVTQSQDHDHGYAVVDYRAIEKEYGTLADFDEFVAQAHARGIGVIIDYVMNHSAADNALFENASAAAGNPYRDWYVWQSSAPSGWSIYGSNPWHSLNNASYFAGFWDQMPDFNLRNPSVLAYHQSTLRFWLNRGVDGFRFDAVGNLIENGPSAWENQPENPVVMGQMHTVVSAYANRYMVCESPAAPQLYGPDSACGASFAFDHRADIVGAAQADEGSIADLAQYFVTAPKGMATLVSNHDAFAGDRLWEQVGGNVAEYRLAAATYLLEPGTPFIYYGEEIGMAGAANLAGDPKLRTPMSWSSNTADAGFTSGTPFRALSANVGANNVAAQVADPNSLLSFYKALIALRTSRPSLMRGDYLAPGVAGRVLSYRRTLGAETTLVVFNYDRTDLSAAVSGLPASATLRRLWPQGGADAIADALGAASIALPRQSFAVFAVQVAP